MPDLTWHRTRRGDYTALTKPGGTPYITVWLPHPHGGKAWVTFHGDVRLTAPNRLSLNAARHAAQEDANRRNGRKR